MRPVPPSLTSTSSMPVCRITRTACTVLKGGSCPMAEPNCHHSGLAAKARPGCRQAGRSKLGTPARRIGAGTIQHGTMIAGRQRLHLRRVRADPGTCDRSGYHQMDRHLVYRQQQERGQSSQDWQSHVRPSPGPREMGGGAVEGWPDGNDLGFDPSILGRSVVCQPLLGVRQHVVCLLDRDEGLGVAGLGHIGVQHPGLRPIGGHNRRLGRSRVQTEPGIVAVRIACWSGWRHGY